MSPAVMLCTDTSFSAATALRAKRVPRITIHRVTVTDPEVHTLTGYGEMDEQPVLYARYTGFARPKRPTKSRRSSTAGDISCETSISAPPSPIESRITAASITCTNEPETSFSCSTSKDSIATPSRMASRIPVRASDPDALLSSAELQSYWQSFLTPKAIPKIHKCIDVRPSIAQVAF